jgi:hypothetical protein
MPKILFGVYRARKKNKRELPLLTGCLWRCMLYKVLAY